MRRPAVGPGAACFPFPAAEQSASGAGIVRRAACVGAALADVALGRAADPATLAAAQSHRGRAPACSRRLRTPRRSRVRLSCCTLPARAGAGTDAEAVRLLLRVWNQRVGFDQRELDAVLRETSRRRSGFGHRLLESVTDGDRARAESVFARFAGVLGPVGAAKALGLLHPTLSVMWDTEIARHYCGSTWRCNAVAAYGRSMSITAVQIRSCRGEPERFGDELLKVIDERNYCRLTQRWM